MARHLSLLTTAQPERTEDAAHALEQPGAGHHVLVVDDGAFTRRLTRQRLERAGFRVTFSQDAPRQDPFDAIVCTIDVLLALRRPVRFEELCVVVLTPTDPTDGARELAESAGAFTIVPADDVVDGLLEALWEATPSAFATR
jgi:hypothetical protein